MLDVDELPTPVQIPERIDKLKESIATSRSGTTEIRFSLAHEASALHQVYRRIIETSIRILEQTIHGSVARGTNAKAIYLALVAEGMSKKLELQHGQLMSQLYSSEVRDALQLRSEQIRNEAKVVIAKFRETEEKLEEYRKAAGMESLAQEYADILKETERVNGEVARLEDSRKS
jgi:cell division septum initiation protein DivIVA